MLYAQIIIDVSAGFCHAFSMITERDHVCTVQYGTREPMKRLVFQREWAECWRRASAEVISEAAERQLEAGPEAGRRPAHSIFPALPPLPPYGPKVVTTLQPAWMLDLWATRKALVTLRAR